MIKWLQFGQDIPNWLALWVLIWATWELVSWVAREVRIWRRNREELRQVLEANEEADRRYWVGPPDEDGNFRYQKRPYNDGGPVL